MSADKLLIFGSGFLLIMALGQLIVYRKQSANYWLCALFVVSFIWTAHAAGYLVGALERYPHLNKTYLPLLCLTGYFWYNYVRSLYDVAAEDLFDRRELLPALICILLSIPFYLQDESFKRHYTETDVTNFTTASMYAATRVAELSMAIFLARTLIFLQNIDSTAAAGKKHSATEFLWRFTFVGLIATAIRIFGSLIGSTTVSVLIPSLMAVGVFVGMHFLSYRIPLVLSLERASRQIRTHPEGFEILNSYRDRIRAELWFLDPKLKLHSLAQKLGCKPKELSALINAAAGVNFNLFVNELRIEHAKKLLLSKPEMSVLEVCFASGFNSKNAFNSCFKMISAMTPTEYRLAKTNDALN